MSPRMAGWFVVLAMVGLASSGIALAKSKSTKSREAKDAARVKSAENSLRKARDSLQNVQSELMAGNQSLEKKKKEHAELSSKIRALKENLKEKYSKSFKLPEALERQRAAKDAFEREADPILERVRRAVAFQKVLEAAAEAKTELSTVRTQDSISETERELRISELTKRVLAPGELERNTLADDAKATRLHDELGVARGHLIDVKNQVNNAIASDAHLTQSLKALQAANKSVDKAKATVQSLHRRLAETHLRVAQERAAVVQAKNSDKANDNKAKKRK